MRYVLLKIKRIYDPAATADGERILVDRLWPRGLNKDKARVDVWLKEIAPSNDLRKWFGHDRNKWEEFKRRYFRELEGKEELLEQISGKLSQGGVTLLYGAKDEAFNNAVALKEYVERRYTR